MHLFPLSFHRSFISKICTNNFRILFNIIIYNIFCNRWFWLFRFWWFSGSSFIALQKPRRLWMYFKIWTVIFILQSGHLAICFYLSTFTGAGSSTIGSSSIGSTGSFVILIFGLAMDLVLGLDLGLTSSSLISSLISSFTGSSLWINSSTCSPDSSWHFWPFICYFDKVIPKLN